MMRLELSNAEERILREVLESTLSDLRMEMADTDSKDFRDTLKERKRVLEKVLAAMGPPRPGAVA